MTLFYSCKTKAFYDTSFSYRSLPDDVVEVSPNDHLSLVDAINNQQKEIVLDSNGKLSLVDKPATITWQAIRYMRDKYLAASDYTQMVDFPGDKDAWAEYRQQLRDITTNFNDPNEVVWPEKPK